MPILTIKGQLTIPKEIRESLGLRHGDEIEFIEEEGRVYIRKKTTIEKEEAKFQQFKGQIKLSTTTDDLIDELRGEDPPDNSN